MTELDAHTRFWLLAVAAACAACGPDPIAGPYTSIVVGQGRSCRLEPDRTIRCWGRNYLGKSVPPAGEFVAVSLTYWDVCGLRDDGTIACGPDGEPEGAGHSFASLGGECRLLEDGTAFCDGKVPAEGTFVQISGGAWRGCGIATSGDLVCWGWAVETPVGEFLQVSVEDLGGSGCAVDSWGQLACWTESLIAFEDPPAGKFVQVARANEYACAVTRDGALTCWGDDTHDQLQAPDGVFVEVAVDDTHACARSEDGPVVCWGDDHDGKASPPPELPYTQISLNASGMCGLLEGGRADCWGRAPTIDLPNLTSGLGDEPDGVFVQISVGGRQTCARTEAGEVECWGYDPNAPDGLFSSIDVGGQHACGVRIDGTLSCWTDPDWIDVSPSPTQGFVEVSVGSAANGCVLLRERTLACWGASELSDVPTGTFVRVDVSSINDAHDLHACAIRTDGTVVCWGWNEFGQASAPAGDFIDVACGANHSCGLLVDGSIRCWGAGIDSYPDCTDVPTDSPHCGQSAPLEGPFVGLSAGLRTTCGIRPDGDVRCWGAQAR